MHSCQKLKLEAEAAGSSKLKLQSVRISGPACWVCMEEAVSHDDNLCLYEHSPVWLVA